ncbi:MAG: hypothetical protein Q9188_001297 [Gyalolechia gomerana]
MRGGRRWLFRRVGAKDQRTNNNLRGRLLSGGKKTGAILPKLQEYVAIHAVYRGLGILLNEHAFLDFWDTRIAVSDTPHSNCRIPHVPDQADFIKHWFDWHRGYTIIRKPDGTEERQELRGESLSEVPLGRLPRTLEELQAPPGPSRHPPRRRYRARRRVPAGSPHTVSSNLLPNDDRHIPHVINRYGDATRTSMTSSQPSDTPHVDPEDRIFDSSSSSTSLSASDTEEHEDNPTSARQRLLLNLQQNLDDVRANVLELTQRTPQARNASQVSTVTNQINAITRRLTNIRRQNLSPQHNSNPGRAMANPYWFSDIPSNSSPVTGLNQTPEDPDFNSFSDEALRQRIDRLRREESEAHASGLDPGDSSIDRQSRISNIGRISGQRRRAEQERWNREALARGSETRDESERQSSGHQSPPRSILTHLPLTPQANQGLMSNRRLLAAHLDRESLYRDYNQNANRGWTSRPRPAGASRSDQGNSEASSLWNSTVNGRAASSDVPVAFNSPRYWAIPPGPSSHDRTNSHRPSRVVRRRPIQQASDTQPSGTTLHHRDGPELFSYPHDLIGSGQSDNPGNERLSSLRETASPQGWVPRTEAFRASQSLLDAPVPPEPRLSRSSFETLIGEHAATSRYPEAYREFQAWRSRFDAERGGRRPDVQAQASLDNDSTRPEPLPEAAMTVKMECKICFAQISNHAVLPCGG